MQKTDDDDAKGSFDVIHHDKGSRLSQAQRFNTASKRKAASGHRSSSTKAEKKKTRAPSKDLLNGVTPEAHQVAMKLLLSQTPTSNNPLRATQESRQVFSELCLPGNIVLSSWFSGNRSTIESEEDLHDCNHDTEKENRKTLEVNRNDEKF